MPDSSALNIPQSPVAALGSVTLLVAFVVAAYACAAGLIGNSQQRSRLVQSSVYALYGFFALSMLASALLIYAFVSHDYTIKYVSQYSDTSMPIYYKITAYWGGLDGSMMFWVAVLAAFSAVAVWTNHERHRDMIGYVVAVVMVVQLFFLAVIIYDKNPFATWLTEPPADGKGLNPLLQNYWMVIHPPSLYIGYVAATIPFAFGMAALLSGRLDDRWLASVRGWTLLCWFFLTFGLILGGRWAYEELGWGGYWAWDPVENAGLLPWFTATAFLHSVIIQEQRGMLKVWNLALVMITFLLTIMGTFMTRSGWVQSVHAFGQDNRLGLLFILFMMVIAVVSLGLLLFRLPQLRSVSRFESFASREFAFLLNNWVLLGCAFFVLFATWFPTLSEAVTEERITVGPPFFNKFMVPLGLTLLVLAGAAPLLAWRRTTTERLGRQFLFPTALSLIGLIAIAVFLPRSRVLSPFFSDHIRLPLSLVCFGIVIFLHASVWQEFWVGIGVRRRQSGSDPITALIGLLVTKRRKYGGYIIHIAVAVMFFGFAGKAYESMEDFTVSKPGETFSMRGYTFRYLELTSVNDDHKHAVTGKVELWREKEHELIDVLEPARWKYQKYPNEPTTEVDISSYLEEDVYLILTGFEPDAGVANFRVYINPLVNWVWLGFFILVIGTALCMIPQRWVNQLTLNRTRTRLGKVGQAAVVLAIFAALSIGMVRVARAQAPPGGGGGGGAAQYQEDGGHMTGASAAHLYRPNGDEVLGRYRPAAVAAVKAAHPDLDPSSPEFASAVSAELKPISDLAARTMLDLVCLCGGCQREDILQCKCGFAANERQEVIGILSQHDLSSAEGREAAHQDVIEKFVAKYEAKRSGDGQRVLMVPADSSFNRLSWLVPYIAFGGGLVLLITFGRRWVRRGQQVEAEKARRSANSGRSDDDDEYAELLDDELRDTD